MSRFGVTILVPIKVESLEALTGFQQCYMDLLAEPLSFDIHLVIADESPAFIFQSLAGWFQEHRHAVTHFCPTDAERTGANDKLNGVLAGLSVARHNCIILLDDHYRPTRSEITTAASLFDSYDCFKLLPKFATFSPAVLIDLAGMCVVSGYHPFGQFYGHLCFDKQQLLEFGFPSRDVLFDELALELPFRQAGRRVGFVSTFGFSSINNTSWKKFFKQRVRYAYENFAFPIRTTFHLSVAPILCLLRVLTNTFAWPGAFAAIVTMSMLLLGLVGRRKLNRSLPLACVAFVPCWFWFYPFSAWLAVLSRLLFGGVSFGGRLVRSPL